MFGGNWSGVLKRSLTPVFCTSQRNWGQIGTHLVVTPPRVKCSLGEKVGHAAFMMFIWVAPMAYFMTQIKVWRREYIGT